MTIEWAEDTELGQGYQQTTFDLGDDPDGEGQVFATLVKADPPTSTTGAILYVHGFTDYFFQRELADFFTARGYAFYALDLRKCGRSRRDGQLAHYVSDLALYDDELDRALDVVRSETGHSVLLSAHSTGGLILPLWLARRRTRHGGGVDPGVTGLILNSPWFDLQGAPWMRTIGTQVIRGVSALRPKEPMRLPASTNYGASIAASEQGEWDYNLVFKPVAGFPVTFGWLNAVRRGQARFHRGLDVGVPSLVLRSTRTYFSTRFSDRSVGADTVLDVKQIARWSGCLGGHTTVVPIEGAKHDVFLSPQAARDQAYATVDTWLKDRGLL